MKLRKFIPIFIIFALFIMVMISDLPHYLNFQTFQAHQKTFEQFVASNVVLSLIVYMGIYIIIVTLSIPGATFMTIAGGFLFGEWMGTAMAVISATIGACFLFLSARMASSDLLIKKAGGFVSRMKAGFQQNALSYLLTLRLIPLFPFIAVNLAAALFQIPMRIFFLGTMFGIIPGSFVYSYMGVAFREAINNQDFSPRFMLDSKILGIFIGLGILSLLPAIYQRLKKH